MTATSTAKLNEKTSDKPVNQQLSIKKVFCKGLLFEAASLTADILKASSDPNLELQASVNNSEQANDITEVVLSLNLTAKVNGNLLWRVQLQQSGFYTLQGFNEDQKQQILNGYCANQLYHYASVIINNTVTQGGFSPVFLAPMNFDVLYKQQLEQSKADQKTKPVTPTVGQH